MNATLFTVHGKVQGVFYRASTKKRAEEIGITGWVRNISNGTVEVHAEGSADQLKQLEAWLHNGPQDAIVSHVDTRLTEVEHHNSFEKIRGVHDVKTT